MATPPRLTVSGLPRHPTPENTASPARGAEMRDFLTSRLQKKNRAPPLVHSWDFWHDRQDRSAFNPNPNNTNTNDAHPNYEDRLVPLAEVHDVRTFWAVFNNFDIAQLPLRDSVHLFHRGVKPVWEDPRNASGGSWTFRVPKSHAPEFWKEVCMMAIGEQLQNAVESERKTFRDDVCGVSLGVRFNSMLIQVWNRDGAHTQGIEQLLATIVGGLAPELVPREGSYYYKKHSEHSGFGAGAGAASDASQAVHGTSSASHPASVTESTPPNVPTMQGEAVTQKKKNLDPAEDMRYAIGDMKAAMDSVENRGVE